MAIGNFVMPTGANSKIRINRKYRNPLAAARAQRHRIDSSYFASGSSSSEQPNRHIEEKDMRFFEYAALPK